jgi:lipopolysaccharide exporter
LLRLLKRHSEFIGNVATMMSGRTLAAAIALVTMPIVARLFQPSDFGVVAVFIAIVSLSLTVATLRYELTIVLPKEESEATALLALTYRVLACFCIGMLSLIAMYRVSGVTLGTLDLLGHWLWLVPLGVLLAGVNEIQESWLARNKEFRTASTALVAGNTSTSAIRIGVGAAWGSSAWGLVSSYLLGALCRSAVQQSAMRGAASRAIFGHVDRVEMLGLARHYSDFPKLNMPAGLVFSIGQNLPVLMFGAMFSPAVVGYYAMANRLTEVPLSIVANSIRKVFLQKSAEIANREGDLRRAFLLTVAGLAATGALPALLLAYFGELLLVWLLGPAWTTAGEYVEIMAYFLFMHWAAAPTGPVFIVLRRQDTWLRLQALMAALRAAALGMAYLLGTDAVWALKAFILASVIGYAAEMLLALICINTKRNTPKAPS